MSSGTSVLCPAAWLDTPTTCTSFSTASRAASSGVWNSGPTSTSKPRSANAVAITLAPRSWPSWPSFATSMRGPATVGRRRTRRPRRAPARSPRRPRSAAPYTPAMLRIVARWRANTSSMRVGDLADGRARPRRLDRQLEQVAVAARAVAQRVERGLARALRRGRRGAAASRASLLLADARCCRCRGRRRRLSSVEPVLVDADDRPRRRGRSRPAGAPPPPRCAASACPTRPPWSCRRAPRPPRSASTPRRRGSCGERLDVVASRRAGRPRG